MTCSHPSCDRTARYNGRCDWHQSDFRGLGIIRCAIPSCGRPLRDHELSNPCYDPRLHGPPGPMPGGNRGRCGTEAGEKRHRRAGETVCDPCRRAANRASEERKAARRAG